MPKLAQKFVGWVAAKSVESGVGANILQAGIVQTLLQCILETRALHARGWAATPDAFRADALPPQLAMSFKQSARLPQRS